MGALGLIVNGKDLLDVIRNLPLVHVEAAASVAFAARREGSDGGCGLYSSVLPFLYSQVVCVVCSAVMALLFVSKAHAGMHPSRNSGSTHCYLFNPQLCYCDLKSKPWVRCIY